MALRGPLDVGIGDRIKISSKEHNFVSMATVRNRTEQPDERASSLVHLQFENAEFPVDR